MRASRRLKQGRPAGDSGVAAIEFAIVCPVLLILLFGIINMMQDLMVSRQVNTAAAFVADVITRSNTNIPAATVDDILTGAQLVIRPTIANAFHVDVYTFTRNGNAAAIRWQRSSANGTACPAPVVNMANANDPIGSMLNDPQVASEVVVAVACLNYTPPIANFPLVGQIFRPRTIVRTIALPPRQSVTLGLI